MTRLNSSTAKEHRRIMDVEPRSLVNFGILEDMMITNDRFGTLNRSQINPNYR